MNPTGYAQVVYESFSGNSSGNREQNHSFIYGLERISQVRSYQASFNNLTQRIYYVYDGHGSVRALTDPTGAVTDTYDYDAFGNLIHSSSSVSSRQSRCIASDTPETGNSHARNTLVIWIVRHFAHAKRECPGARVRESTCFH